MNFNADSIEAWAADYPDSGSANALVGLIEHDRNLPQPGGFPVGSPQRMLAESRQRTLLKQAVKLGYQPPVKELVTTIIKEAVKSELLGLSPIADTPVGAALDKLPMPEATPVPETEQQVVDKARERPAGAERRKKQRDTGGLEIGFEF